MRKVLLTLIIVFFVIRIFSQVNPEQRRVLNVENDTINGIQFIPLDALNGNYDVLVEGMDFDTINITQKKAIQLIWRDKRTAGSYYLVITPRQMYLKSGHENPNPNFLYWIKGISKIQYELIKNYLNNKARKEFDDYSIEGSYYQDFFYKNYRKEKYRNGVWTDKQYENFVSLLKLINGVFKSKDMLIEIPDFKSFNKIQPLRLVLDLHELDYSVKIIRIQ